jgi:6-phosphogluconolactonase
LIGGFPVATPVCCTSSSSGLTVNSTGRFLCVAATSEADSAYSIDAVTGAITAVAGSPFTVAVGSETDSLSVDGSGKFLYVSSYVYTSANPGAVEALAVNQRTGALTAACWSSSATPIATVIDTAGSKGLATSTGFG